MKFFKQSAKVVLLLFGLLPVFLFAMSYIMLEPGEKTQDLLFIVMFWLTAISIPGAFIFYVVDVYRNKGVMKNQRHIWAALLFFGNIFAYPFYWYLHVWREPKASGQN